MFRVRSRPGPFIRAISMGCTHVLAAWGHLGLSRFERSRGKCFFFSTYYSSQKNGSNLFWSLPLRVTYTAGDRGETSVFQGKKNSVLRIISRGRVYIYYFIHTRIRAVYYVRRAAMFVVHSNCTNCLLRTRHILLLWWWK